MAITVQEAQVVFSADGMGKVTSAAGQARKAMDGMVSSAGRVMSGLRGIGRFGGETMQVLGVLGAGAVVAGMVKMAAETETLAVQMKVLTGSAETAATVLKQIETFAAETPFQSDEISAAARSLIAFGSNADTVVSELRMLGDIASGTGVPLGELAELYGKAQVQGRLFAEDINQLTGRGIPIIQGLAKEFGVADSQVKLLVEQGKVGFPEMQRALAGMTTDGGRFAGMMEQMSQTTSGRFSTLMDNVKLLGRDIGTALLPPANEIMEWAIDFVGNVDGIGTSFSTVVQSVRTWFTETQQKMMTVGAVVGAVSADLPRLFALAFDDIKTLASNLFSWMAENTGILGEKIYAGLANAKAAVFGGETVTAGEFTAMPEFVSTLAADMKTIVADAMRQSQSAIAEAAKQQAAAAGNEVQAAARDAFTPSQQRTAAGTTAAMSQARGSALSMFQRVQSAVANGTVFQQQLEQQKQTTAATQKTAESTAMMAASLAAGIMVAPILQ
jgi:tape measure domain-containing protein